MYIVFTHCSEPCVLYIISRPELLSTSRGLGRRRSFHRMKCFLGILIAFGLTVTGCDAECIFRRLYFNPLKVTTGCVDQLGVEHGFNTVWKTKECYECSCSTIGISCCNLATKPFGFDVEKCSAIFHIESCSYSLVSKFDPSKTCAAAQWIR
ncbi:beta-microseminoprotein [Ornithorhynchus anatinus]|uniref:Beta-microseminoprotein n=1 Tax=Ornithorhynchus anatinus TaxID=9258 RepID=A0A6I8NIQ5_ORNAN|nr:beta-microseminoprotein [Ornithorhynchus anatinus]